MNTHPNETPEPLAQGQAGEMPEPHWAAGYSGPLPEGAYSAEQMRAALQAKDAEIAEWRKLSDPAVLHANLLRGLPAQLTREQLLHLLGDDAEIARLKGDAGRLDALESVTVENQWILAKNSDSFTASLGRPRHATRRTLREAIDAAMKGEAS